MLISKNISLFIKFINWYWKDKKMVGAVCPSSSSLAKKMLKNVDFKKADVIVEFGAGTGVLTKRILEQMNENAILFVFELNYSFYQNLKDEIQDKRLVLIYDSAEFMHKYLNTYEITHVDYVISSLPLTNLSNKLKRKILQHTHASLKENGRYIQFQYSLNSKKHIESVFQQVYLNFTLFNLPPAFVYTCVKGYNTYSHEI